MSGDTKILDDLWGVIEERSSSLDKKSYTRIMLEKDTNTLARNCLLYTSPSPRD